jgi:hypothetical protein
VKAGVANAGIDTRAPDDKQASSPMTNSRLVYAKGHVCPHTTYVGELASQTT